MCLKSNDCPKHFCEHECLYNAALNGNTQRLVELILNGADVSQTSMPGRHQLIHFTGRPGSAEAMKALLDAGADASAVSYDGQTPLHMAAADGGIEQVQMLIGAGTNVNARTMDDETPLHQAARAGEEEIAKLLIAAGADVTARDCYGQSPLHHSASRGHLGVVQVLLDAGADMSALDNKGDTAALHSLSDAPASVKLMIEKGADVSVRGQGGDTLLHRAASFSAELIGLLLGAGADLEATDDEGKTPLHAAAAWGDAEHVRILLAAGADMGARTNDGETALHLTAGSPDALFLGFGHESDAKARVLLDAGVDVNARTVSDADAMNSSRAGRPSKSPLFLVIAAILIFAVAVEASYGDRLPEFRECVQVCHDENCAPGKDATPIPFHRRLLLWTCASECDYACQHIITKERLAAGERVVQFHGKWPFPRMLGIQEPASTLFSLGNLWAHQNGWRKLRAVIPASYPLRPWYEWLAGVGIASWTFSAIFHTRDFVATEQLDYFAAGASVLYGLYYTVVRIMRLDRPTPRRRSVLRAWTLLCVLLYAGHIAYLKGVRWDYTYNMTANVIIGVIQNLMWLWFSLNKYRQSRRTWAIWPSIVVAVVVMVMSLELFDFPPVWGALDAHSLWHLGTIPPTVLIFLIKDAQDDMAGSERLKS
ncbi:hypothetical protein CTAM01_07826 [Colletotrichum tamarilloi]|uniref:Post-GPI attachment to proteins factor 3 n=1 Tax=Colletotrichum tamarilloi TaxID=1209934 RepID=A0ABQ9R831_9PEZI|nr:uncharacterized protein CTAM01_07826 [Colletotrichum tamarilloi]KAK1497556.1 hypothetical protein CTAM01_07826 [Colletotrichum tamarilloi]